MTMSKISLFPYLLVPEAVGKVSWHVLVINQCGCLFYFYFAVPVFYLLYLQSNTSLSYVKSRNIQFYALPESILYCKLAITEELIYFVFTVCIILFISR